MGPALSVVIQQLHQPQTPALQILVSSSPFLILHGHKMMESICLDDELDADPEWDLIDRPYNEPHTPSTISDNHPDADTDTQTHQYDTSDAGSDEEYGEPSGTAPKRKKGGYDSRIEQILYENPDLPILIVDAGKSLESGGKYIVYTIRTGVCLVHSL